MGRLISFDSIVQEQVASLIKNSKCIQTGLIIGQSTAQKDIVVRLCKTLEKDEEQEESATGDTAKKRKATSALAELDEPWICQHAKQLVRTLPGGIDVLGFFIIAPSDYTTKNQVHLRQVLFSLYKIKSLKLKMMSKEKVLLTVCPLTSKTVCRTYDVFDYKCSAVPADWKLQTGNLKWHNLRCQLTVYIKFPLKKSDSNCSSLQSQIELSLRSYFENIENALVLFNGVTREMNELLDASSDSKRSKKKQTNDKSEASEWQDVELYLSLKNDDFTDTSKMTEIFTATSMMTFKGIVQSRGYVHAKATVQEAVNALKQDIIRSIISRYEIHCEDLLLIEEEQSDPAVVHEIPRRVFAPLPQGNICVSDYQFHSDTACDSFETFKELLNLEISEENIDTSCEISPTTSTLILPEVADDKLSEFGDGPIPSSSMKLTPAVGVIATIAVGIIAFIIKSQWN